MVLERKRFIEHVLWHAPETNQHTVRQYGLYAYQARLKRNQCRSILGQLPEQDAGVSLNWRNYLTSIGQKAKDICSKSGKPLLRFSLIRSLRQPNENSI